MRDTAVPKQLCPACGHLVTHAADFGVDGATPEPGDWVACIACASVNRFRFDMRLEMVPKAEVAARIAEDKAKGEKYGIANLLTALNVMFAELGRPRTVIPSKVKH